MRRQQLPPELAEDVAPKNILMIGPTGVGKTEIARRLARLSQSPFIKVEASKFTEVGYVGRDVESMVRDLVEIAVGLVRDEQRAAVRERARQQAEERLLDLLLPPPPRGRRGRRARPADAPPTATTHSAPVTASASSCAKDVSTTGRSRSRRASAPCRPSRSSAGRRSRRWAST